MRNSRFFSCEVVTLQPPPGVCLSVSSGGPSVYAPVCALLNGLSMTLN